ncbi:MAG: NAD-dependent epimerase/dehydratase family protein [Candidatus Aenigmarchaeota archaeon]|nr:NAD-dependent epimerase/dehydratase family protein [Candidatus Aenigmarchaeota archaeon]
MKIFVTGGTGFIGSHLVKALVSEGNQVFVLTSKKEKIKEVENLGAEAVLGHLKSLAFLKKVLKGIEEVYHLAAIRDRWGTNRQEYQEVNVLGTKNLLEASKKNKIKHFIFCSSVTVLGYPEETPICESSPCVPKTLYGQSKHQAEQLVKRYQKKGLPTTIIRPTVAYGPGDTAGMMLKLCKLVKEKKFKIVGNGKNRLHLIYVDDLINGLFLARNPRTFGQTYILTYKNSITVNELVKLVASILKVKISLQYVPLRFAKIVGFLMENFYYVVRIKKEPLVTRSKVDLFTKNQIYDVSKAKKELGFSSKIGYREGVKKTIHWYKKNRII